MTTWSDPERRLIARYLAGLGLRRASCAYYKLVLNSFHVGWTMVAMGTGMEIMHPMPINSTRRL